MDSVNSAQSGQPQIIRNQQAQPIQLIEDVRAQQIPEMNEIHRQIYQEIPLRWELQRQIPEMDDFPPPLLQYRFRNQNNMPFMHAREFEQVYSRKIYPRRSSENSGRRACLQYLMNTGNVRNIREPETPQSQSVRNSHIKERNRQKNFRIACQRNNKVKMIPNQDRPKIPLNKQINPNPRNGPNFNDYQMKDNPQFESYFQRCKAEFCDQRCKSGNPIKKTCVQKGCYSEANHCNETTCESCKENHKNCFLKLQSEMLGKSLQRNLIRQKKAMQIVFETYSYIQNQIKENREKIMKFLCVQGINSNLLGKLQQRYKNYGRIQFKSNEVLSTLQMLSTQSQNNDFRQRTIFDKMQKDKNDIIDKLSKQMRFLLEPFTNCQLTILNSHLVTNKSDIKFVLEHLNFPKDMTLLYRASQHQFSIRKFHQICDKEDNTFTIIKTEFGKLIGGFTPLKWNDKYGRDRTNSTFMLSISMKEKLEHIKHGQSVIYYNDCFGPSFGGLFQSRDIEIFEENGVLSCNTNFPNAYNWKRFFSSNQQGWRFLTGVQVGKKCRVMDYEVFKVHFWKK